MKSQQSDRLSRLLQENRPAAPRSSEHEWDRIESSITRDVSQRRRPFGMAWQLWAPVMVTAMLLIGILWLRDTPQLTAPQISDAALGEYLLETYAVLDNGSNGIDPSVGNEWLMLIQ